MLDQHVIDNRAVFVALGTAIGVDDGINGFHKLGAIGQTKLLHQEILLHRFDFTCLRACNGGCIRIIDLWTAANRNLRQQSHIRLHPTFRAKIICVNSDQIVSLAHNFLPVRLRGLPHFPYHADSAARTGKNKEKIPKRAFANENGRFGTSLNAKRRPEFRAASFDFSQSYEISSGSAQA